MVNFLLNKGANPNIADKLGRTPLAIASELGLGGYREPGEENPYQKIIELLTSVQNKSQQISKQDIEKLSEKMSKLGLNSQKRATANSSSKDETPEQSNTDNTEKTCRIIS